MRAYALTVVPFFGMLSEVCGADTERDFADEGRGPISRRSPTWVRVLKIVCGGNSSTLSAFRITFEILNGRTCSSMWTTWLLRSRKTMSIENNIPMVCTP